jgi:hypothetical protein
MVHLPQRSEPSRDSTVQPPAHAAASVPCTTGDRLVAGVAPLGAALAVSLALAGCTDLASVGGGSGRTCSGSILGISDITFIRRGFCENTFAELTFRPKVPVHCEGLPIGTRWDALLTTSDGAFVCAPLRVIPPIEHDQLGRLDFPGGRRLDNRVYSVRRTRGPEDGSVRDCATLGPGAVYDPEAPCGQDALAIVSFVDDGRVELRVLAGAGTSNAGARCVGPSAGYSTGRDLFGVFSMSCRD